MKKKILLLLLILNIFSIFAVAQTSIFTDTLKTNAVQEIEILKNEINNLKNDIKYINEKSLKTENIKALLETNKKDEKKSPIWVITVIVSLYSGIFVFLVVAVGHIKNIPPTLGEILGNALKRTVLICIFFIIVLFLCIFYNISWLLLPIAVINFILLTYLAVISIEYVNIRNLTWKIFKSRPDRFKDSIEFYLNKEDFDMAYNLLNSIKLDDVNNNKFFNKIKIKLNLKKDYSKTVEKSISAIQSLFKNENLVYKKIIYRDFLKSYIKLLFKTQDFKFIEKEVYNFVSIFAVFMKQKGEYYQKLYENCVENFVFIIAKAIKDINVSKEKKFIDYLIDSFITYAFVMIRYNKIDPLRYMFEEMIKVVRSIEFTEDNFLTLKSKFLKIFNPRTKDVNDILMFFFHRVIKNRMGKKVSSGLINELLEHQYNFVFVQCKDSEHWNTYLKEYLAINNQEFAGILKQYSLR